MLPIARLRPVAPSPLRVFVLTLALALLATAPAAAATAPTTQPDKHPPTAAPAKPGAAAAPSKPDPKASKTPAKPDPKASKTPAKPGPKTPAKPDPKASKSEPKPDPKASKPTSPPDPKASSPDPKASSPAAPPAPPAPPSTAGGYWLGARLLGAVEAQALALADMSSGTGTENAPDGAVAGQAATMPEAMAWVARWAFGGPALPLPAPEPAASPLQLGPAPVPGGPLFTTRGALLHALTIRGRNLDGSLRAIRWPGTAAELTPPDQKWLPAVLLAERAPLFAAPSAHVPPAAERFAFARRSGALWLLGHVDRCTGASGERVCLRWAQVLARHGDEFHAGYLPAAQVARVDGWKRGAGAAPRAQLLATGTTGTRAQFLLVARTRDGGLHRRTLGAPMTGDAYPAAKLRIEGEWAIVEITGTGTQRIALDASLDAR